MNTELTEKVPEIIEVPMVQTDNILINAKAMNQIYRLASHFANSQMVPKDYQGKPDNCFVACELAARMNLSPITVMQNLYIVQGKPSWSGQMCISLINGCRKFDRDLEFVYVGNPGTLTHGCYAVTSRHGKELKSVTVTMQMAKDEGWLDKNGSKWKTMPEQMMMYRSAAFFARVYCPNVLMGYSTDDESQDTSEEGKQTIVVLGGNGNGDGVEGQDS